ncbi:ArsR/SmtB family transcription factor [Salinactinospora qingdaonensis]|uniref:HTH arsR-type domain-containing protein n=1 Tax=Salinactinospora qingdaonensis TaxID=702744 RepID=A0ABP7FHM3_9ACTN
MAMNAAGIYTADDGGGGCEAELTPAVSLFRSLGDPVRLALLRHLAHGEARVADLTELLGLAQSTVSKHLACLRGCGLVDYRPQGRQSFYSVARPELLDLLGAAENLLEGTGSAVALCPAYGTDALAEQQPDLPEEVTQ